MAQITITFDDALQTRIVNALAGTHDYQAQIRNEAGELVTNPETKGQFAIKCLRAWVKSVVVEYEKTQAAKAAEATAKATAENEIVLT